MENKVLEAAELLKKAEAAMKEVINVIQIYTGADRQIRVQVFSWRDLEKIPGETETILFDCEGSEHKWEARKICNGVLFFCLLGGEEESIAKEI